MVAEPIPEAPALSQDEYHDLRADHAAGRGPNGSLWQRCTRCGQCEYAGGFCSRCLTEDYVLEAHFHTGRGKEPSCPLGTPYATAIRSVVGFYHHLPGASLRRFPVAMREASAGELAARAKAVAVRRARRAT